MTNDMQSVPVHELLQGQQCVLAARQRNDLEASVDGMDEEKDSAQRKLFYDGNKHIGNGIRGETGKEHFFTDICSRDDIWTTRQQTARD